MNRDFQKFGWPLDGKYGEVNIRIDSTGQWYHEDSLIRRIELVRLFATLLKKDKKGDYWLETPAEKILIQVEDVPFIAIAMNVENRGKNQSLTFEPNVGDIFKAGANNPIKIKTNIVNLQPSPYVIVRDNLEAKITRSVFYDMVNLGIKLDGIYGIWSNGVFFPLDNVENSNWDDQRQIFLRTQKFGMVNTEIK